jgi:hypothetical protein
MGKDRCSRGCLLMAEFIDRLRNNPFETEGYRKGYRD